MVLIFVVTRQTVYRLNRFLADMTIGAVAGGLFKPRKETEQTSVTL